MPKCKACRKEISEEQYLKFNKFCPQCEQTRQDIEKKFKGDEEELSKYWYLWVIICIIGTITSLIYFISYIFIGF